MTGIASQDVYTTLFDRIISGELPAGTRMKEVALTKEFGVSRTPVRDALRQLTHDGLIEIVPAQGARVVSFAADDVEDVYDIRMSLEILAIEIIGHTLRLQPLIELRKRLLNADQQNDLHEQIEIDTLLHRYIVQSTGRRYLLRVFDEMGRLMQRFRYLGFKDQKMIQRASDEHVALMDALLIHDVNTAREIMENHIRNSKLCTLAQLHKGSYSVGNIAVNQKPSG